MVADERCLVNAKLKEYTLGSDDAELEVQKCYLDALAAHTRAYNYFQDSLPSLRWGRAKYWLFKPRTWIVAVGSAAFGGYLARAAWFTTEDLPFFSTVKDVIDVWFGR